MSQPIIFPQSYPHHHAMTNVINSFAAQYEVVRIYLTFMQSSGKHLVLIHIAHSIVPDHILHTKWIRKALHQYNTHIIILANADITRNLRLGSLFLYRYGTNSNIIYQKQNHSFASPDSTKLFKKFKNFKQHYYHTHQLLSCEIQKAQKDESLTRAYRLYITLFEHHLFYLELLHTGRYFINDTLDERFLRLEYYLPEIKCLMLKKTSTTHYITHALYSAKIADEQQDYIFLKYEFSESISKVEKQLYQLVEKTFSDTKHAVKNPATPQKTLRPNQSISIYEPVLEILTKHFHIHEIFLFHHQAFDSGKNQVLYILLISDNISNQNLTEMTQRITEQTRSQYNIVPIAHSKVWIQEHLFEYQTFFQKVMTPDNSIYRAGQPSLIHWRTPYTDEHPDLDFYTRHCLDLYHNYTLFRDTITTNTEGVGVLISVLVYRTCTTLLYASLSYRPNHINIRILWRLCQYAEPKVKRLDYLISKLSFDFFTFLNPSKNLYKTCYPISNPDRHILDEIIQNLINLLNQHTTNKINL